MSQLQGKKKKKKKHRDTAGTCRLIKPASLYHNRFYLRCQNEGLGGVDVGWWSCEGCRAAVAKGQCRAVVLGMSWGALRAHPWRELSQVGCFDLRT